MAGSHGRELWFDTDLGDEYTFICAAHALYIKGGTSE